MPGHCTIGLSQVVLVERFEAADPSSHVDRAECSRPPPSREPQGKGTWARGYTGAVLALVFNRQYTILLVHPKLAAAA